MAALPDLASGTDLSARGVTPTSVHDTMLAVASALVRGAARAPILETDSTVVLVGWAYEKWLDLPGNPVTAVTGVSINGQTVTDSRLAAGRLWRQGGWGVDFGPSEVEVELTHGLAEVPADIVQLVCDLAILGANTATAGAIDPTKVAERIDDYSVEYAKGAEQVASAMSLPTAVRAALRTRFGGGAGVVTYR